MKAFIKDDFKDLIEYRSWVSERLQNLKINHEELSEFTKESVEQTMRYHPQWYGPKTSFAEMESGITEFKDPELIEKIYQQVSAQLNANIHQKIQSKKVNYNAMGLGVFVFDRAAMGLYRNKEYYAVKHKIVVEPEQVNLDKTSLTLKSDKSMVVHRWEEREDGRPKARTSSKKVFAWYPPQDKQNRAVEIIISAGGNSKVTASEFLYSGISAIITAEILQKARVKTKISILFGSTPDKQNFYGCLVPIKNYDQTLDRNLIALLSSDPRFFRHEGFKGLVASYEEFNTKIPEGYGFGVTRNTLPDLIDKSGYAESKKLSPNRFYYGWTFSENNAVDIINDSIEEISKRLNS